MPCHKHAEAHVVRRTAAHPPYQGHDELAIVGGGLTFLVPRRGRQLKWRTPRQPRRRAASTCEAPAMPEAEGVPLLAPPAAAGGRWAQISAGSGVTGVVQRSPLRVRGMRANRSCRFAGARIGANCQPPPSRLPPPTSPAAIAPPHTHHHHPRVLERTRSLNGGVGSGRHFVCPSTSDPERARDHVALIRSGSVFTPRRPSRHAARPSRGSHRRPKSHGPSIPSTTLAVYSSRILCPGIWHVVACTYS